MGMLPAFNTLIISRGKEYNGSDKRTQSRYSTRLLLLERSDRDFESTYVKRYKISFFILE